MRESNEVKLARIEEGISALRATVEMHHKAVGEKIAHMVPKVETQALDIEVLKRDRWWVFGLASACGSGLSMLFYRITRG